MTENKIEALKMQYQTLLAEYQVMRQSISGYRSMQGELDNITLAALGISIPIILTILDRSLDYMGVILLIPILFFAVAFTQLRHERMILVAALYVDGQLRPQIEQILSKLAKENLPVLQWESFLTQQIWTRGVLGEWLAISLRAILGFGAGTGIIGLYAFIRFTQPQNIHPFEKWLLIINAILFIVDLVIAFGIARQRKSYNGENEYAKK